MAKVVAVAGEQIIRRGRIDRVLLAPRLKLVQGAFRRAQANNLERFQQASAASKGLGVVFLNAVATSKVELVT